MTIGTHDAAPDALSNSTSNQMTIEESRVLSDPHWRGKLDRLLREAFLRADGNVSYVNQAYSRLMNNVPSPHPSWSTQNDLTALRNLRRVIRVMKAFADLSREQRDILRGHLPVRETFQKTGNEIVAIKLILQRDVWEGQADLAELRAEMDADHERASQALRQKVADDGVVLLEYQKIEADAPGIVFAWQERGIRLELRSRRAKAWPASKLTDAETALLARHNAAFVLAIQNDWTA